MKPTETPNPAHRKQCHLCKFSPQVSALAEWENRITAELERIERRRIELEAEREKLDTERKRLADVCTRCNPLDDWSHRGREVSLDAMGGGENIPAKAPDDGDGKEVEQPLTEALTLDEQRGALKVLRVLMGCDWRGILLVWGFLHQMERAQIAKLLGISKQRFQYHFMLAMRSPILKALYYSAARFKAEDKGEGDGE